MHNLISSPTIMAFLGKALAALIDILLPVIVICFIVTGLIFVTARGDPEKLKTAKMALLYTVIGTAIILGAWVLAQMIGDTLNAIKGP